MSKSNWFGDDDHNGNFSNGGQDTFDPKKKYVGIRLQQGVPLLDRDWNELEDIRHYEEQMLRKWYIGDGIPDDDGFKIMPLDVPGNDFKIKAGRCLVDGLEAVNDNKDGFILYSAQKDGDADSEEISDLTNFKAYLDVWIEEVNKDDDPALANDEDVDMETCVRHQLKWRVRVRSGSGTFAPEDHHHYYDLAKIERNDKTDPIEEGHITDFRRVGLALHRLSDRLTTNQIADDLHCHRKLVARVGSQDPALSVDNSGNVGIGTMAPSRILHVEDEIHSGGSRGGFSFADRSIQVFVERPTKGERWVWHSAGGAARLWSGNDILAVDKDGNLQTSGTISGTFEGILEGYIRVKDTRNDNDPPGKFDQEVSFDFKSRSAVGAPGVGTYSGMVTLAPWKAGGKGGFHHQLNFNDGGIFWRTGETLKTNQTNRWGPWLKIKIEEPSDERFEVSKTPLNNVLDKLENVRGISFEWNDLYESLGYPSNGGRREIGLIAQEVEAAFPELVTYHGDEKYRVLNYERLTAVLVEAVKELVEAEKGLRAEVETLKRKINS